MSEQLAQIREWLEGCGRLITCKNDIDHVKHHAKRCLELLDEYEESLVRVEGVEEAMAGLEIHGENIVQALGCSHVRLGVEHHCAVNLTVANTSVATGRLLEITVQMTDYGFKRHVAQVLATMMHLEGKRTEYAEIVEELKAEGKW